MATKCGTNPLHAAALVRHLFLHNSIEIGSLILICLFYRIACIFLLNRMVIWKLSSFSLKKASKLINLIDLAQVHCITLVKYEFLVLKTRFSFFFQKNPRLILNSIFDDTWLAFDRAAIWKLSNTYWKRLSLSINKTNDVKLLSALLAKYV